MVSSQVEGNPCVVRGAQHYKTPPSTTLVAGGSFVSNN